MPRTRRLSVLAALGLLAAGLAVAPPSSATAAAPDRAPHVRVAKVTATSASTASGTTVTTTLRLKNVTATRKDERSTRLFLTNAGGTHRLGSAAVPALRGRKSTTVRVVSTVRLRVPAGTYAVRACRGPLAAERCRTSSATVTVAPAGLAAAPATLAFGGVEVGAAAVRRDVTITNTGQSVTGALTTSATGAFSVAASTCTASLVPGASCTVSVGFAPGTPGAVAGSLSVSGASTAATSVALSGTGLRPAALVADVSSLTFGATLVGATSAPAQVVVTNQGDVASGEPAVSLARSADSDFQIAGTTCTTALAPGASCTVDVTVSPSVDAQRAGELSVAATPGGVATTSLRATGLAPASLGLAPGALAFGEQVLGGTTRTQVLTLTNGGDVATGRPVVELGGTDADQFSIVRDGCTAAVPAGASCEVEVAFAPSDRGVASASLVVSAGPGGVTSAALGGTGQAPARLTVEESSYDFGFSGAPDEHRFTVTNEGDATSGVPVVAVDGSGAFTVTTDTCAPAIAGGASCTVGVTYTGTGSSLQSADVSVSAAPGGTVTVALSGSPVALSISPSTHDFGDVEVGQASAARVFTLTNHRRQPVDVTGMAWTSHLDGVYACFGVTIPAGGTCSASLTLTPQAAGSATGFVQYWAAGTSAQLDVTATGYTPAALSITPSTHDFGYGTTTAPGTAQVGVTNTGGRPTSTLGFTVAGTDPADFSIDAAACPLVLAPGDGCTATATFAPQSLGPKSATIQVTGAPQPVSTTLTGVAVPEGVSMTPTSWDYGTRALGSRTAQTFRVLNMTDAAINGANMISWGNSNFDPTQYDCFMTSIPARGSCTITLDFVPHQSGLISSTLTAQGWGWSASSPITGTGAGAALAPARAASRDLPTRGAPTSVLAPR